MSTRRVIRGVALVTLALSLAVQLSVAATPAVAGTGCGWAGCSQTYDDSNGAVKIAHDWCISGGSSGSTSTRIPACKGQNFGWVYPGAHSPSGQDWDAFRAPAGWCIKVTFVYPGPDVTKRYNRIGRGATWVKVRDGIPARVKAQSSTHCP